MKKRYNPRIAQPNKYRSKKVVAEGQTFDSRKEYTEWLKLMIQQKEGKIRNLTRQVRYELIPKQVGLDGKCLERACHYVADFVYEDNETGETVVVDAKGYRTPEYRIKKKLMLWILGIRIREV